MSDDDEGYLYRASHQLTDQQLSETEIPSSATDIDLTANRLQKLDQRIIDLEGLKVISFRQNLLSDVSALTSMRSSTVLRELNLNDNHIEQLPSLENFKNLESFDASFNKIRNTDAATTLTDCPLKHLFYANNKISEVGGVAILTSLESLELGSNKLRSMEGLDGLDLHELYLGRNKITNITNLGGYANLRILAMPSNRITKIEGLEACVNLEELYLSHNGVKEIGGLDTLVKLNTLDIATNQVTDIKNVEKLVCLEHLWLNHNQITDLGCVATGLVSVLTTINTVYLEGNPAAQDDEYRTKMVSMLPNLFQLDAHLVKKEEREAAASYTAGAGDGPSS